MTTNIIGQGAWQAPSGSGGGVVTLSNTSETQVFEAPDNAATLVAMTIINANGSARDVLIEWYNGTTDFPIYYATVAAKTTVNVEYPRIPMREGHKIKATGNTDVTVFLTISRTHAGLAAR